MEIFNKFYINVCNIANNINWLYEPVALIISVYV